MCPRWRSRGAKDGRREAGRRPRFFRFVGGKNARDLDGEVFVADVGGIERRLGPGDVAFFPYGAKTLWRVPDHVKKVAVVKPPMPGPVASAMRWARMAKHWIKPAPAFAAN